MVQKGAHTPTRGPCNQSGFAAPSAAAEMAPMSTKAMVSVSPEIRTYLKSESISSVVPISVNSTELAKPEIVLDMTVADLYAKDRHDGDKPMAFIPCYWCSDLDYTKTISRTTKYLYQGTPPPASRTEACELVIQCLSLESQRFTFVAGKMETIMFDFGDRIGCQDAKRTFSVLPKTQRPKVTSALGIQDLIQKRATSCFSVVVPHEKLPSHQQLVNPETLYELLSKRCLALSNLPTPRSAVLDLDSAPGSASHKVTLTAFWIRSFPLPRVFKTQQGMSSVGTFIVQTESEREELIHHLSTGILRTTLNSVNSTNVHLRPSSLISQEMITHSTDCFATSFFVRRSGECIFFGACRQDMSDTNIWLGASIRYLEQDHLKQRLSPTVAKIGNFLHMKGYHGPAGADIIIDDRDARAPREWIIDLNVRMTGSLTLTFLRGNFSDRRGLHEACITQRFKFPVERDGFRELFAREFAEGKIIIVAWYHDTTTGFSWGNLVLAGRNQDGLAGLMKRVQLVSV